AGPWTTIANIHSGGSDMTEGPLQGVKACVFDAYGTLFDFAAAARRCRDVLGDDIAKLTIVLNIGVRTMPSIALEARLPVRHLRWCAGPLALCRTHRCNGPQCHQSRRHNSGSSTSRLIGRSAPTSTRPICSRVIS